MRQRAGQLARVPCDRFARHSCGWLHLSGVRRWAWRSCRDKVYLVPWRESRPVVAVSLGVLPEPASDRAYAGPYHAGRVCGPLAFRVDGKTFRVATAICFEVAYATLHRNSMLAGAPGARPDFFAGAAHEAGFEGSQYARLGFEAQRFRAIECRRAYARSAERGISAIVDGNGRVVVSEEMTTDSKPLAAHVPIDHRFSPYVVLGDWLPIGCCLIVVGLGSARLVRKHPRRSAY